MSWERRPDYNPNNFRTYPFTRDRYTVYPWYNFYKHREPPLWFFREIIMRLVIAFDSWEKIFIQREEPYDLFIRIYDPHYILSDIHCVKMEQQGDKYLYWPPSEVSKNFPFDKFGCKDYNLSKFDWELRVELSLLKYFLSILPSIFTIHHGKCCLQSIWLKTLHIQKH